MVAGRYLGRYRYPVRHVISYASAALYVPNLGCSRALEVPGLGKISGPGQRNKITLQSSNSGKHDTENHLLGCVVVKATTAISLIPSSMIHYLREAGKDARARKDGFDVP